MATATHTPPVRQNNVHIVMLKYKPTVDEAAKSALAKAFDALQTQCVSPSTGKPYIASLKAGKVKINSLKLVGDRMWMPGCSD